MTTLLYNPGQDLIWLGCSYAEVRKHFINAMDADGLRKYIKIKEQWSSDRRLQHASNIMDIYNIDYMPDIFILTSRDLGVCTIHEQYYPFSLDVPDGTFLECDHIELGLPSQLERLVITHDGGEAFSNMENQFEKVKLYLDLDGTLVDFESGIKKVPVKVQREYWDHPEDIEGVFALMEPMPGAIKAVKVLSEYYDCFILSTAPWDNPSAWADKDRWVQKYFGDVFFKKVILTHRKDLLSDGESLLVDDRYAHGATKFKENLVRFNPDLDTWDDITDVLVNHALNLGVGLYFENN
ncbi:MAG: hypothetical protein MJZ16_12085 [Bacteroidales bacterium]|nr:hypothetical protein [Bacteroidales bacterium]